MILFHLISTADDERKKEIVKRVIRRKFDELGPITFHELSVLILFCICVLLWFFRNPQFITGWGSFFPVYYIANPIDYSLYTNYEYSIFLLKSGGFNSGYFHFNFALHFSSRNANFWKRYNFLNFSTIGILHHD